VLTQARAQGFAPALPSRRASSTSFHGAGTGSVRAGWTTSRTQYLVERKYVPRCSPSGVSTVNVLGAICGSWYVLFFRWMGYPAWPGLGAPQQQCLCKRLWLQTRIWMTHLSLHTLAEPVSGTTLMRAALQRRLEKLEQVQREKDASERRSRAQMQRASAACLEAIRRTKDGPYPDFCGTKPFEPPR
jgi:hypothetical protein